ncbi:Pentatricopeptide repeat-containing protein, chloroplastic, partial [Cucurbita argyrosperma subsp. argyrosperma]
MRAILYACQAVGLVRVSVGRIVYIDWVGQHSIGLRCEAELLQKVQAQIITHGFQHNEYVAPNLVSAWAGLKRMDYARHLFDHFPDPKLALWNATFRGYVRNEFYREVIFLSGKMKRMDVRPNCFTFPLVLKSCAKISAFVEGEQIHCEVIKGGFEGNQFVATTLIDVYSVGRAIGSAYKVFVGMLERNVVAWTSMISGYILCNDVVFARRLFDLAPERDVVLWNIMVSGYIEIGDMAAARKLFDAMPYRDVMSWNTMLNGYANNGDIEACEQLFEEMPERNVFSWNGLIGAYAHKGCFFEVLGCFKRMLIDGLVVPNDATLVTVLSACARLGALDLGKWVHVYAATIGFKGSIYVGNALIDMYSKCGVIENAMEVFGSMDSKDVITWNSVICGLATHGCGADALNLFHQMKITGVKPDGITFIGVLCSCTHLGLVKEGISHFNSMVHDYSIVPQIEHYGCMVDLFGRAGLLDRAIEFVKRMPMEADAVIWAALLGACRIHKNIDLGELALQKLIQLEPKNPANYVMLSNIYGDVGRWKDVARLKILMRDTGSKKLPGCSLIEVNDSVVEFYSLDERHSESEEIYGVLKGLMKLLRSFGYEPNIMELLQG